MLETQVEVDPWSLPLLDRWGPKEGWSLPAVLERQAERWGPKPFVRVESGEPESFAEVREASLDVAARFAGIGVVAGDRVLTMADTSLDLLHVWFGINLCGALDAPLNPAYRGTVLAHAVNLCEAEVLVLDPRFLDVIAGVEADLTHLRTVITLGEAKATFTRLACAALVDLAPKTDAVFPAVSYRDAASIIYTSGTSGPAKGVINTHAQTYLSAYQTIDALHMTSDDIYYTFHPMFHMAAKYCAVFASLVAGCTIVIDRTFDPTIWLDHIRAYGATVSMAHGPMLEMIFSQPVRADDAENPLRALIAAPFPSAIAEPFESRFGVRGFETWGMTEVTCVTWQPYEGQRPPGSCGRPITELFDLLIVDPDTDEAVPAGTIGEITVRPLHPWTLMLGYYGMPESTVHAWRNFRFHSGDAGYLDDDGFLYFVDRKGDRIRRRAENISSYHIEAAATRHAAVAECAAVGVPSDYSADDDILVCVVPVEGATIDPVELTEHFVRELPHYMVPRYIQVLDQLPRSATNKVQKARLREVGVAGTTWDRTEAGISIREMSDRQAAR